MSNTLTLLAKTSPVPVDLDITTRAVTEADIPTLSPLIFDAYHHHEAYPDAASVQRYLDALFSGEHGPLLLDASQLAITDEGKIIAGVLVVERSPDPQNPNTPFLVELFTCQDYRRQGLAERLVITAGSRLFQAGYPQVSVSIQEDNLPALTLYLSLDFHRWDKDEDD